MSAKEEILIRITDHLRNHPELRFCQVLSDLRINYDLWDSPVDIYYESDEQVLERMKRYEQVQNI